MTFKTLNDLLFGFENIVVIYLAARLALDNVLTIGMIFAFMAYKLQFVEKSVQLVEKGIDFRLLELHLERLSDIALNPIEARPRADLRPIVRPIQGKIELKDVSFRYAATEPFVFEKREPDCRSRGICDDCRSFWAWKDDARKDHARTARTDQRRGFDRWYSSFWHRH